MYRRFSLLLSASLCLFSFYFHQSRHNLFHRVQDYTVPNAITHNHTARDDDPPIAPPPPYVWDDFMYFANEFPSENEKYAVISAFLDAMRLALAGVKTIHSLQNDENPSSGSISSFPRYFNQIDHPKVRGIFTNVLAVLGMPEAEKQCVLLPRLPLLYDDTWNLARYCVNQPDLRAYMVASSNPGESFMIICPYFFENYRRVSDIQCDTLGSYAENGFPLHNGMWSSGSVLLHGTLNIWRAKIVDRRWLSHQSYCIGRIRAWPKWESVSRTK